MGNYPFYPFLSGALLNGSSVYIFTNLFLLQIDFILQHCEQGQDLQHTLTTSV